LIPAGIPHNPAKVTNGGAIFAGAGSLAPPLLVLVGSDLDTRLILGAESIRTTGSSDLHLLIDQTIPYFLMHVTKNFFKQVPTRPDLLPFRTALNLVTDPDQNPKVLSNIEKLLRGFRGRVVNRPEAVLRTSRDQVARMLAGIPGLMVPRTVRLGSAKAEIAARAIARANLRFPILLRKAGTHTGQFIGVFENADEAARAMAPTGDHIVTEFVDFASAGSLYRKYRVFFIGERIIFRHMLVSDQWNVHASDRTRFMASRAELLAEEERVLANPSGGLPSEALDTLRRVRERMRLDYFGIDFAITPAGGILLFEANATMNFFPFLDDSRFAYVKQSLKPAYEAMHDLIGVAPPGRQGLSHEKSVA
jgi:glutathione synthase/RimK-type ligase-like ATP-grasp enzyme